MRKIRDSHSLIVAQSPIRFGRVTPLKHSPASLAFMSLSLRHANEKDIPAINAIYNEGGVGTTASYDLEPLTIEDQTRWWEGLQAQGYPVIVAIQEKDVVTGFAYLRDFKLVLMTHTLSSTHPQEMS